MAQKNESPFVGHLEKLIQDVLAEHFDALSVVRGHRLEYQSGFDGQSIFETDLCILEGKVPRVVLELKTSPTTHDVMIYSQKADDHKRFSPQLVYGMIAERGEVVATKFMKHNRHMDFAIYLGGLSDTGISEMLNSCISGYIEESKLRERLASGSYTPRGFFRKTICQ